MFSKKFPFKNFLWNFFQILLFEIMFSGNCYLKILILKISFLNLFSKICGLKFFFGRKKFGKKIFINKFRKKKVWKKNSNQKFSVKKFFVKILWTNFVLIVDEVGREWNGLKWVDGGWGWYFFIYLPKEQGISMNRIGLYFLWIILLINFIKIVYDSILENYKL